MTFVTLLTICLIIRKKFEVKKVAPGENRTHDQGVTSQTPELDELHFLGAIIF